MSIYWLAAALFAVGAVCGATIRLLVFVGVLFVGAVVAAIAGATGGAGVMLLTIVIALAVLQAGYAAGFVLRAATRRRRASGRVPTGQPQVRGTLGEKRP